MTFGRSDPGACLVCGAAHCACGGGGSLTTVQLPARDAAELARVPLVAELGDGADGRPFSTGTYRGIKKART